MYDQQDVSKLYAVVALHGNLEGNVHHQGHRAMSQLGSKI